MVPAEQTQGAQYFGVARVKGSGCGVDVKRECQIEERFVMQFGFRYLSVALKLTLFVSGSLYTRMAFSSQLRLVDWKYPLLRLSTMFAQRPSQKLLSHASDSRDHRPSLFGCPLGIPGMLTHNLAEDET